MPVKAAFFVPHPPLIIPAVGRGKENEISKTVSSYRKIALQIKKIAPDTIVFITPHCAMYSDYFHISPGTRARGSFARFNAAGSVYEAEYDTGFIHDIVGLAKKNNINAGTDGERDAALDHGTMIPIHFINEVYSGYKSVRISISGLGFNEHFKLGELIGKAAGEKNIVIIASGDLSHKLTKDGPYGFAKEGPEFDKKIAEIIEAGDLGKLSELPEDLCENAAECGLRCLIIAAGALGSSYRSILLSYEGPFGVGYLCASFFTEDPYVNLARRTLEGYVKNKKTPPAPDGLPDEMLSERAGVFVSIKKFGDLRGCIGTIMPATENIASEIIMNAVSSGARDPRFYPVTENELNDLQYSVDVLMPPEPINSFTELDVLKYGVIVSTAYKRGLLLPNLDGVETVQEQVGIALKKAGIEPGVKCKMERFEVVRHK